MMQWDMWTEDAAVCGAEGEISATGQKITLSSAEKPHQESSLTLWAEEMTAGAAYLSPKLFHWGTCVKRLATFS